MPEKVVVAEFDSADAVVAAAERVRAIGYARLDALSPYPIPELEGPLAIRRTRVRGLVLASGLAAGFAAFVVMHWTNAVAYPLDVGGRPLDSYPTYVPIVFESAVLGAALAAFLGVLLAARLPRLHHPLFELEGFERTTVDRFWLLVSNVTGEADDVGAEERETLRAELARMGASSVRFVSPAEVSP